MFRNIIDLLNVDDFYGSGENIEIAKGKYKVAMTIKEGREQLKRRKHENHNIRS